MAIGQRIRSIRLQRGLSLTELANRSGTAKSYISSVERELQLNPSIQFLNKISSVLGVSVEDLIKDGAPDQTVIDQEWMNLAKEAMESGISKEQFKEFLDFQKWQKMNK